MAESGWLEEERHHQLVFRPAQTPPGILVAFSGRGAAPENSGSPTAFLARRFAAALSLDGTPIVRASQVHGNTAVVVREAPSDGTIQDAGKCDILVTNLPGVALVVQTADCLPILLTSPRAVGTAHAGWRGSACNAAGAAVRALAELGAEPRSLSARLGPAIGACCYEVGGEVAAQFAGQFLRSSCEGRYRLDLHAVNRAQLEAAGVLPENISSHPACTQCGGERFASYRRDGAAAGRMIALVVRLARTEAMSDLT
ncbi:MAG: peptidoglycan editing factor PgeF [Thermoanaerobaculia bacterium]